jgi:hypothetical protein
MTGFQLILQTVFTDNSLPIIGDDPIISRGSLALLDFASDKGYTAAAVPSLASVIPNVAWKQAARIIGTGDQTSLASKVSFNAGVEPELKREFTPKRGLHVLSSQVNQSANRGYIIAMSDLIRGHLYNNPNHSYFMGGWYRVTRPALVATNTFFGGIGNKSGTPGSCIILIQPGANVPAAGSAKSLGESNFPNPSNVVGNIYRSVASSSMTGAVPAAVGNWDALLLRIANEGAYQSLERNKTASVVFYKVYLEDLTVSGRSFAEVDNLFKSQFDAAFAVGGIYNGDTIPTDPSTFP